MEVKKVDQFFTWKLGGGEYAIIYCPEGEIKGDESDGNWIIICVGLTLDDARTMARRLRRS